MPLKLMRATAQNLPRPSKLGLLYNSGPLGGPSSCPSVPAAIYMAAGSAAGSAFLPWRCASALKESIVQLAGYEAVLSSRKRRRKHATVMPSVHVARAPCGCSELAWPEKSVGLSDSRLGVSPPEVTQRRAPRWQVPATAGPARLSAPRCPRAGMTPGGRLPVGGEIKGAGLGHPAS